MARPYLCPVCKANRTHFDLIFKMAQEIRKDGESGATLYRSDELVTLTHRDGRLDLDVRCARCGYTGSESTYIKAAEREAGAPVRR